jgi:hypothetical protein
LEWWCGFRFQVLFLEPKSSLNARFRLDEVIIDLMIEMAMRGDS